MTISTEIRERVARGADWLFKRRPKALWRIDLKHLDLGDSCNCVLGQEWGEYFEAMKALGYDTSRPEDRAWAQHHGFVLTPDQFDAKPLDYPPLTAAWRAEIKRRRAESDGDARRD